MKENEDTFEPDEARTGHTAYMCVALSSAFFKSMWLFSIYDEAVDVAIFYFFIRIRRRSHFRNWTMRRMIFFKRYKIKRFKLSSQEERMQRFKFCYCFFCRTYKKIASPHWENDRPTHRDYWRRTRTACAASRKIYTTP